MDHQPFVSTLSIGGNVVTNLIERSAGQDRYRKQLRIIRFESRSEWPESMEAYLVAPDGTLEPMFTLRLHSISKFRPRDVSLFAMTNHFVFDPLEIVSLKKGVKTTISIPGKPWNFVLIEGIPIPYFALWILGGTLGLVGVILLLPLLRDSEVNGPRRERKGLRAHPTGRGILWDKQFPIPFGTRGALRFPRRFSGRRHWLRSKR
jgi:hypothetical protein